MENKIYSRDEYRQKKERLKQLTEEQNPKGFHIPNPIRAAKDMRERAVLKKEIAQYEEKRQTIWAIVICFSVLVIIGCIVAAMAKKENEEKLSVSLSDYSDSVQEYSSVPSVEPSEGSSISDPEAKEVSSGSELIENEKENVAAQSEIDMQHGKEQAVESLGNGEYETIPAELAHITINDLSVSALREYAHTDTNIMFLGTGENATITVVISEADVSLEDILFVYDEVDLNVNINEPDHLENKTIIEANVTGKRSCETELVVFTTYDVLLLKENAEGFVFDIRQLDSIEGRVVYVTPEGEKYHFSELCVGENAVKTICRDAIVYEYEPCGKCAQ